MPSIGNSTAAETAWPSSKTVSDEKKKLLAYYFSLLDTNEATAGEKIAKVFTDDGCMISPAGKVHGSEPFEISPGRPGKSANLALEIQSSRQHAWDVIKTRSHKLIRVYVFDSDATDLLVIGTVVQGLANGKSVSGEWAARICLEQGPAGNFKIKSHHVWTDFGGAQKAIQEALSG